MDPALSIMHPALGFTASEDTPLACSLCGIPSRPPGQCRLDQEWLTKAELLSDPDDEFEAREQHYRAGKLQGAPVFAMPDGPPATIRREAATGLSRTEYRLVGDDRTRHPEWTDGDDHVRRPNWTARFGADGVPAAQPYSIVVHAACADIAARVVRHPRHGVRLNSFRTLWKVLRTRFDARDNEYIYTSYSFRNNALAHEENYYLVRQDFDPDWSVPAYAVADPLSVPDLTGGLLLNLELMNAAAPPSDVEKDFQTRFQQLPPELRAKIVSFMFRPDGLPSACTRLLGPSAWRDILLEPKFLPFLWDLDVKLVIAYDETERRQGHVLDWEGLVRKLSLKPSLGNKDYWTLDIPGGLRNRRRIWQLVEEMYVGDQLRAPSSAPPDGRRLPTMPKYWDEDGEPLHPVTRMSVYRPIDA